MKGDLIIIANLQSTDESVVTTSLNPNEDQTQITNDPVSLRSAHICSLILNAFLWIQLLFFIILGISFQSGRVIRPFDHHIIIFLICFGILYIFYVVEVFTSSTMRILYRKKKLSRVEEYVKKIKEAEPEIRFVSQSFHYPDEINRRDIESSKKNTRRFFTNSKIITNCASTDFEFHSAVDQSDEMLHTFKDYDIIHFRFHTRIAFGDNYTENQYYQKLEEFNMANRNIDLHYQVEEIKKIHGLQEKVVAINDQTASFFFSPFWFVIVSCLFLISWPYRVWVQSKTARSYFTIQKILYCDAARR